MLDSHFRPLCEVDLPYAGRQRYMAGLDLADPVMPEGYEDYLAPVLALTRAAGAVLGQAWMTVDEKIVPAGRSQRRPGPHVDGQFQSGPQRWGHNDPSPVWAHGCNELPLSRMPIIIAASAVGARAWSGRFDAEPSSTGDLSHACGLLGEGEVLAAGVGYLLSGDCVHESLLMTEPTQRTFLRIALPVDFVVERR